MIVNRTFSISNYIPSIGNSVCKIFRPSGPPKIHRLVKVSLFYDQTLLSSSQHYTYFNVLFRFYETKEKRKLFSYETRIVRWFRILTSLFHTTSEVPPVSDHPTVRLFHRRVGSRLTILGLHVSHTALVSGSFSSQSSWRVFVVIDSDLL